MFDFLLIAAMGAITELKDLDRLFGRDDFDSAFHESDRAVVEFQSCVAKMCDKWKLGFVISEKNSSSAIISTYDADGAEIGREPLNKKDWEDGKHNRIRIKLENLKDQGYRAHIKSIRKFARMILINGENQFIETYIVEIVATQSKQPITKYSIEIATGVGGLGQMVKALEFSGSKLESYEVKELEFHKNENSVL